MSIVTWLSLLRYRTEWKKSVEVLSILGTHHIPLHLDRPEREQLQFFIVDSVKFSKGEAILRCVNEDYLIEDLEVGMPLQFSTLPNAFYNIQFISKIKKLPKENKTRAHVTLPKSFVNIECRQVFRVEVESMIEVNVKTQQDEQTTQGKLSNISYNGMKITFPGDVTQSMLADHTILLSSKAIFLTASNDCYLRVIWSQYSEERDETDMGCEFIVLDDVQRKSLGFFITKIQIQHSVKDNM